MRGPPITKRMSAEVSGEDFDKIVAVTQKSIYWGVIVVMPYLVREGKGVMMNMSRVTATRVRPGRCLLEG
jgi:NADP-dependent 3-hydroxy acid dehydrogenase YdfG